MANQGQFVEFQNQKQQFQDEQEENDSGFKHERDANDVNIFCPNLCGVVSCIVGCIFPPCWLNSFKVVNERQQGIISLCGEYVATKKEPGCFLLNPLSEFKAVEIAEQTYDIPDIKVIDQNGTPIDISGIVSFIIQDSKKAIIDVQDYSDQVYKLSQISMKQVCQAYPYDSDHGKSLKGNTDEIAYQVKLKIQEAVNKTGVKIKNFGFNGISYAPEIAGQMLVKQKAMAQVQAKKTIIEGSCGLAVQAVKRLQTEGIQMNEQMQGQLVANLLTVMVSDQGAQPTMNVNV